MEDNEAKAFKQVDELLEQNEEMLSALYKMSKLSQNTEEKVQSFADDFADVESMRSHIRDVNELRSVLESYGEDIDYNMFFAERVLLSMSFGNIEEIYQDYLEEFGHKRLFREIMLDGPNNAYEEHLVMAATAFLDPADFKNAITTGASIADVSAMIDNSVVKKFTDIQIQQIGSDKIENAIDAAAEAHENPLSAKFGLLDLVQHSLENSEIVQEHHHKPIVHDEVSR